MQVGNLENATKNETDPEIKAFLAFVKNNKAESGFPQPSQFLDF